jgi:NAD(P)-dependent dehydrogenase (short-subunit alcohol dehydrogenase family)
MGLLDGRVVVVTGAGRGLGRCYTLRCAAEGASVLANDLVGAPGVAEEIVATGGRAVAHTGDVADWATAEELIRTAVDAFGDLHVLVNNAAVMRPRHLPDMSEEEWDEVIRVDLKGTFCPLRFAARYWRGRAHVGDHQDRAVVNMTSGDSLHFGPPTMANYAAAKAGVSALTKIYADELEPFGVRVNEIAPGALTPMCEEVPGLPELMRAQIADGFDPWDPGHVAPLVVYFAQASCEVTGQVFRLQGGALTLYTGWRPAGARRKQARWEVDQLQTVVPELLAEVPGEHVEAGYVDMRARIDAALTRQ